MKIKLSAKPNHYCKNVDELKDLHANNAINQIDFKKQIKDLYAWRKDQRPIFSCTTEQEILYDKIKSKGIKN